MPDIHRLGTENLGQYTRNNVVPFTHSNNLNEDDHKPKRRKTRNFTDTKSSLRSGRTSQLKPSVIKKMEKIKRGIQEVPTLGVEKKKMMLEQLPREIMADPRNFVNTVENDKSPGLRKNDTKSD